MILVLLIAPLVVAACETEGMNIEEDATCLLTLKSSMRYSATSRLSSALKAHAAWTNRHNKLKDNLRQLPKLMVVDAGRSREIHAAAKAAQSPLLSSDTVNIQAFIDAQKSSADACHAKMLEVRRTLDGLMSKVNALSDETEGYNAVIESNTGILHENTRNREDDKEMFEKDMAECERQYKLDIASSLNYEAEIKELEQIANPEVRSEIASSSDVRAAVEAHSDEQMSKPQEHFKQSRDGSNGKNYTTINLASLSNENCQSVAKAVLKKFHAPHADDDETMLACNGTRSKLQETYEVAMHALAKLIIDGDELAEDSKEECELAAKAASQARQGIYDAAISEATLNVNAARMALGQLTILLDNANMEVKLLGSHLTKLKEDCVVEDGVSEHLVAVRNLIVSLEDCPGRHDFVLTKPTEPPSE